MFLESHCHVLGDLRNLKTCPRADQDTLTPLNCKDPACLQVSGEHIVCSGVYFNPAHVQVSKILSRMKKKEPSHLILFTRNSNKKALVISDGRRQMVVAGVGDRGVICKGDCRDFLA